MTNFSDLPQAVRERIYRMHLVQDEPLDFGAFLRAVKQAPYARGRFMPPVCQISKKIEKEAATIFYNENSFEFPGLADIRLFLSKSILRHHKFIHHIGFKYKSASYDGSEVLKRVGRLKGLKVLTIRLDERDMVRDMLRRYGNGIAWDSGGTFTPQQQMKLLRFPAMSALLTISGLQEVRLLKLHDFNKDESDGPIPGGFFETRVRSQLTSVKEEETNASQGTSTFRFLDLPAELRNRVYELVLTVEGPIHPSKQDPTSAPRWSAEKAAPSSVLGILQTSKQIHDEADGLFYHHNQFNFYNPMQFQSFITDIGSLRASMLRNIAIHYQNTRIGGVDTADIAFGQLRQLRGLRRVTVIMDRMWSWQLRERERSAWIQTVEANPGDLSGIPRLFDLRGLDHVEVQDPPLDKAIERLSTEKGYPYFTANTAQNRINRAIAKMGFALKHFNEALADAQLGKVNRKLLKHNCWQSWDVFPSLEHDGIQDLDKAT